MLLLVTTVANYAVFRYHFKPEDLAAEKKFVQKQLKLCLRNIEQRLESIDNNCYDLSNWDKMYQYISCPYSDFSSNNLDETTARGLKLNILYALNNSGKVVSSIILDRNYKVTDEMPEFPTGNWCMSSPLLDLPNINTAKKGFLVTGKGLMVVSVRHILKTDETGPSNGFLVTGAFIDGNFLESIARDMEFEISVGQATFDFDSEECNQEIMIQTSKKNYNATINERDLAGRPFAFKVSTPIDIGLLAEHRSMETIAAVTVTNIPVIILFWFIYHRLLLKRISKLTDTIHKIHDTKTWEPIKIQTPNDEFGLLVEEFEKMLKTIHDENQQNQALNEKIKLINKELRSISYASSKEMYQSLKTVLSFLRILRNTGDNLNGSERNHLELAISSTEQIQKVIQTLIDYSYTGILPSQAIDLDLNKVLQNIAALFKDQEMSLKIQPLPTIKADMVEMSLLYKSIFNYCLSQVPRNEKLRLEIGAEKTGTKFVYYAKYISIKSTENKPQCNRDSNLKPSDNDEPIELVICKRIIGKYSGKLTFSEEGKFSRIDFTLNPEL